MTLAPSGNWGLFYFPLYHACQTENLDMSRYNDFDAEDVRSKVRLVLLTVAFAIVGLLAWIFGHPTDREELLGIGLFMFMVTLEYLETSRQYIVRLNEITKGRHEELKNNLANDLRELARDTADKLSEIDRAIFDLSLKIED